MTQPSASPISESDILTQVAQGKPGAMERCIGEYGGLVWSIVRKYVSLQADAEDLVQEVFMELWRVAPRYEASLGKESTFIGTLARRRSIDWVRRQGRQPVTAPITPELHEQESASMSSPSPIPSVDREAVVMALQSLTEETRNLFLLHFESGMTHQELADRTGMPLGTIKTRLRRGLVDLRSHLQRLESSNPNLSANA